MNMTHGQSVSSNFEKCHDLISWHVDGNIHNKMYVQLKASGNILPMLAIGGPFCWLTERFCKKVNLKRFMQLFLYYDFFFLTRSAYCNPKCIRKKRKLELWCSHAHLLPGINTVSVWCLAGAVKINSQPHINTAMLSLTLTENTFNHHTTDKKQTESTNCTKHEAAILDPK